MNDKLARELYYAFRRKAFELVGVDMEGWPSLDENVQAAWLEVASVARRIQLRDVNEVR